MAEESGLENREDGSMPSRGFKSLCLRQRLGIQTNSKVFLIEKDLLFQKVFCVCLYLMHIIPKSTIGFKKFLGNFQIFFHQEKHRIFHRCLCGVFYFEMRYL